ncbi:MAG: NUDIX domain-containing protein [Pseudomonadota bacterium]
MTRNYVLYLRKLVGSSPIILTGTSVVVRNERGQILFQRRSDNGLWSLPGGMLEMGDSLEETARREVFEEVGIALHSLELLGVVSGPECFYRYPNGDEVWNVTVVFESEAVAQNPSAKHESLEAVWSTFASMQPNLSPPTRIAAKKLGFLE